MAFDRWRAITLILSRHRDNTRSLDGAMETPQQWDPLPSNNVLPNWEINSWEDMDFAPFRCFYAPR